MPRHHNLEEYLIAYVDGAGLRADPKGTLFRTIGRGTRQLTRTVVEGRSILPAPILRRSMTAFISFKPNSKGCQPGNQVFARGDARDARRLSANYRLGIRVLALAYGHNRRKYRPTKMLAIVAQI